MIEIKLDIKPIPVPIIYQPIYKLVMLLAVLKYGSGKSKNATFLKLHVYLWALRSEENYQVLIQLQRKERNSILPWSFEPGLDKVVTIALINNFCIKDIKSKELQIKLTQQGESLLEKIEDLGIFQEDISKIRIIGIIPLTGIKSANTNWILKL